MECRGIAVDIDELNRVEQIMSREIKLLEEKAGACLGSPVLLNSTVQLRQVLYERLKLDKHLPKSTLYKTAKNQQTSTGEGVLNQLVCHHPFPKIILDYRQVYKTQSTYITALRGYITEGVLRTQWLQTSVSTGRIQSTKPNIQAVPKTSLTFLDETGTGVLVCPRSIYKPREGHTFISVDFRQLELRVFAHITSDKKLANLLKDDCQDIFCNLSSIWMNKNANSVTHAEREKTKKIIYSVMYGVGKYKLSQHLNITPMEAQSITSRFLRDFPRVQEFTNKVVASCREKGYAESILGRRRMLGNIISKNFKDRTHAERQAVNFTIQGSASDICKLVMKEISRELQRSSVMASLLIQIHDELLYEVMDTHVEMAKAIFIRCMETDGGAWYAGLQLRVPLRIALKSGKNWAAMNPI
ncbi:DNA polymerase nu-like [Watersipora subatra]|uniref:DNA polymerase nu-like n=1 Tax=Watersipora subatra TaxID=2589382 RepID=UPI00355AE867